MQFEAFYLIDPRPDLPARLAGRVDPDLAELLTEPVVLSHTEGGCHSLWQPEDHALRVKLVFLASLRQYDTLETDASVEAVFGSSRISAALFDRWWTIRRLEIDDDTERLEPLLVKHLDRVQRTGNEVVDRWLDRTRDHALPPPTET